ncbi:MAG: MBL fold metallo-hydrolase [Vicinamibacterales bacterium]
MDLGQGDGILIQSPSGENVVYDGGEEPSAIANYLQRVGVSGVELVIASHNHADHIGGLAEIVRRVKPGFYMDNAVPATTLIYRRLLEAVAASGARLLAPTARRISMGKVALQIVPPPGVAAWDQNDNSVGVVVEYGNFRLWLGGDAESREWAWWAEHNGPLLGHVHIYKASHHGSSSGDTDQALSQLSPGVVIISTGRGNIYGHPNPAALRLYARHGATVFRTDLHGTIVVEAQTSGRYTVQVERGEGARPPTPALRPAVQPQIAPLPPPQPQGACIDINTATFEELQRIIQVGPARALQIVELRKARPFRSVNELTRVSGIAAGRLGAILAEGIACVR